MRTLFYPSMDTATDMTDHDTDLRAALGRVAELEATANPNTFAGRLLRKVGSTRPFIAFYRRFGPKVDPWLHARTGGRIAPERYGMTSLLLKTIGAKTGLERTSPLLYARDGDDFLIVGTNFGTTHHPAWSGNLLKNPEAAIVVGVDTFKVSAEKVDDATFAAMWPRFTAIYPGYDDYLIRLTHRKPRMFRLRPHV